MRETTETKLPEVRDFTIPEGCLCCEGDLQVRVRAGTGANGVCKKCGWMGRPQMSVTHGGLNVAFQGAAA